MRRELLVCLVMTGIVLISSCKNEVKSGDESSKISENSIVQADDGTISLKINKAECYSDMTNPSNNTADWNVVISKPGRFKVWLSSATKDTSDLKYTNSVRISLLDDQLEAKPACDKIVQNTSEVQYPYFRADSYMGSVYVSEPGEYNIQVISEKITSNTTEFQSTSLADDTKLMSVILMPVTR